MLYLHQNALLVLMIEREIEMKKRVFTEVRMFMLWQALEWMKRVLKEVKECHLDRDSKEQIKALDDVVVRFDNFMGNGL